MKITLTQIESFFNTKEIAVVGVSRNPKKFGYQVYKSLKERGLEIVPVNPNADEIDGDPCYQKIEDIPEKVKHIVIVSRPEFLDSILQSANKKGIQHVWVQKELFTEEMVEYGTKHFDNFIYGECIFMWMNPVKGIHQFHKSIRKLFGGLPR